MTQHVRMAPGVDLYCGDCLDVLRQLAAEGCRVDMVLTDPPYGINYIGRVHGPIANDETPLIGSVKLMADLLDHDRAAYIFTRGDVAHFWREGLADAGLTIRPEVIWDKIHANGAGNVNADYRVQHETLLVAHKGRPKLRPWHDHGRYFPDQPHRVIRRDVTVWSIPVSRDSRSRRHPTPKPPEIMERAMLNDSANGHLVLDPFMGGGPVGVAAVRLGRRYIGIELERDYFDLAVENIDAALAEREAVQKAMAALS